MPWSEFSFVLKPSVLGGLGVFATHNIPANTLILPIPFELRVLKTKDVPQDLLKYCIYLNDEEVVGPERFDRMEIGWFINHSDKPNIMNKAVIRNAESLSIEQTISDMKIRSVYSIKDIKAGDEILVDYNTLNEPEHLKESYYL